MKENYQAQGFDILSVDDLSEYRSRGIYLQHESTGAEVYHVGNEDREKFFSFVFRTPPANHTGVAHILEHAVLSGSQNYPLKDPFILLLKGSVHTFLNAMTYPDKTAYPGSSVITQDYLNLLRVYGDAVFFPLLTREVFRQEGHRLERGEDASLQRMGIVLNEMKGNYSSPESVIDDYTMRSLFPDSPYGWDSGGDPKHIPELTYQEFLNFHKKWYHPSNVRIFLYGDQDLGETLSILNGEFLSRFQRRSLDSSIPLQPRWTREKSLKATWPAAAGESPQGKSTISMNWLMGESTDPQGTLAAQVLSSLLLGHGGAPLQKALMESGLGEDLSPVSGLESSLRQMVFSTGIRGTTPGMEKDFENLVTGTLTNLVKEGFNKDLLEGTLRTVEFRAREIKGGIPFGLRLMKRALRGWLHGRPPVENLVFDQEMKTLRRAAEKNGFFEGLVQTELLDNPHRLTLTVYPDPEQQGREEAEETKELTRLQKAMSPEDLQKMEEEKKSLEIFQETPDQPEDIARIPFLDPEDLPSQVETFPFQKGQEKGIPWHRLDTFTNGVAYLNLAVDLEGLDPQLYPWLPLFARALTEVGLPGMDYSQVSRELALKTGGFGCSLEASPLYSPGGGGELSKRLFLRVKVLEERFEEGLAFVFRVLRDADFQREDRIKDLFLELRNDYRSAILPSGHAFASLRAGARHSASAPWEELWYGAQQLIHLQNTAESLDKKGLSALCEILETLKKTLMRQDRFRLGITGSPQNCSQVLDRALSLTGDLPLGAPAKTEDPPLFRHPQRAESLLVPSSISFSALSLPAAPLGTREHACHSLLAHILRTGYLWDTVRLRGGAYGVSASSSGLEGVFTFSSYRDPVVLPTLEAFKESLEHVQKTLTKEQLKTALIGRIGRELKPAAPGEKGMTGFKRSLYGISDSLRQQQRDYQMSAGVKEIKAAAAGLLDHWDQRAVTVVGGADILEEAARAWPPLGESKIPVPS